MTHTFSEQHVSEYARRIQILNNLITCETQPKQNYEDEDVENIPPARNISPREELLGRNGKYIYVYKY